VTLPPSSIEIDAVMEVMETAFDPYWQEGWTRKQLTDALAFPSTHLITRSPGAKMEASADRRSRRTLAGFVLSRFSGEEEEMLLIAVMPDERGVGLGASLLEDFFNNARARGARRVFLEVRANNEASSFYRRMGFDEIGRRPNYYRARDGRQMDAISMARSL
jgi:ribosomal-protein-alanine N-acetyltransferase